MSIKTAVVVADKDLQSPGELEALTEFPLQAIGIAKSIAGSPQARYSCEFGNDKIREIVGVDKVAFVLPENLLENL